MAVVSTTTWNRPHSIASGFTVLVKVKSTISVVSSRYPMMTHSTASRPFLGFRSISNKNFIILNFFLLFLPRISLIT